MGPEEQAGNTGAGVTRVLLVTRDPVVHAFHGAITAVHNLLALLADHGAEVTVLVTGGESRSPRLAFAEVVPLPPGVRLKVPGYQRIGRRWVRPFAPAGWGRLILRAMQKSGWATEPLMRFLRRIEVDVFDRPWDLTEPTAGERALVLEAVAELRPSAVIANYAFWGPVLSELRSRRGKPDGQPRTLILMHDLLAEHVRLFEQGGMPLDCNRITPGMEAAWLNGADTVLAIQADEAAAVQGRIGAEVLVQPIRLQAEPASAAPEPLRCLFIGSNSPPNVQAVEWITAVVWPLVRQEEPAAVLAVAGSVCDRVGAPGEGVDLVGPVSSIAGEHRRASVCVVPLLVGSGLKIKLLDALRFGKATVSTSVGVQGVREWVEDAVDVADDPAEFAAAIVRLLRDPQLRRRHERAATAAMQRHFAAGSEAEQALLRALRGES